MVAKQNFSIKLLVILTALMIALVGCSSQSSSSPSNSKSNEEKPTNTGTSAADDTKNPIEIKHAFGTTVIKSKPKRVVTIQWGNQDIPLALGVVPVGFSAANFGVQDDSGLLPWTEKNSRNSAKRIQTFSMIQTDWILSLFPTQNRMSFWLLTPA
mgnify:CR=1 FL=1